MPRNVASHLKMEIDKSSTKLMVSEEKIEIEALNPSQIICLEHDQQRLYVELIQILRDRQAGWLRPLCLCIPVEQTRSDTYPNSVQVMCGETAYFLHDLRQTVDLVWPLAQCRMVLDTEALPILSNLDPDPTPVAKREDERRILSCFVNRMWRESQESAG